MSPVDYIYSNYQEPIAKNIYLSNQVFVFTRHHM